MSNEAFAANNSGQILRFPLGQMADLEVEVAHAVVVVDIGEGGDQRPPIDPVTPNGIQVLFNRGGERLFECFFEKSHLSSQVAEFFGVEGRIERAQLAKDVGLPHAQG